MAQAFRRLGAEVTLLTRGAQLLPKEDPDAAAVLKARFEREGIRVVSGAQLERIEMLGGTYEQVIDAVSNAWIDGGALRTYRHAPNTGSRKSWAAGDATSRAVRLALMARAGEMGYPSALGNIYFLLVFVVVIVIFIIVGRVTFYRGER